MSGIFNFATPHNLFGPNVAGELSDSILSGLFGVNRLIYPRLCRVSKGSTASRARSTVG
jgi:hypothetical protein